MKKLKSEEKITRAILTDEGQVMIEQPDGSYLPAGKGKTDFNMLKSMSDETIDYSEIPELTDEFFKVSPNDATIGKSQLTIRIDNDLLDWLKEQGRGYQTRINKILRTYMQVHKSRGI